MISNDDVLLVVGLVVAGLIVLLSTEHAMDYNSVGQRQIKTYNYKTMYVIEMSSTRVNEHCEYDLSGVCKNIIRRLETFFTKYAKCANFV